MRSGSYIVNNINIGQLIGQITAIVSQAVSIALLLLIAAAVLQRYGVRVPYLPATGPTELAYMAGAWWLYRGRP